jgi:hypothetical protein
MARRQVEEFSEDELAALVGPYWRHGDPLPLQEASPSPTLGFRDGDDGGTGRNSSHRAALRQEGVTLRSRYTHDDS